MKKTMKAMVLVEPKKLELREVPIPEPGPKDVVFKVIYSAVCGSDFPIYNHGLYVPKLPQIIGHEFSGVVTAMGDEVEGLEIGDRIMGTNLKWCGECEWCQAGDVYNCPYIAVSGLGFGMPGVFAEYSMISNALVGLTLIKLPDTTNDLLMACAEPMCVGPSNVEKFEIPEGSKVAIFGAGMQGQSHLQSLRAKNIKDVEIAVLDFSPLRLSLAKENGADHIINLGEREDHDGAEALMDLWGDTEFAYNYGSRISGRVDVVYECSGKPKAFTQGFKALNNRGKYCQVGTCETMAQIHPQWIEQKVPEIYTGIGGNFKAAVDKIDSGEFQVQNLVTHVFPLEELEEAMQVAMDPMRSMKVVIKNDPTAPDYEYNKMD